jgi:hypothetical protein
MSSDICRDGLTKKHSTVENDNCADKIAVNNGRSHVQIERKRKETRARKRESTSMAFFSLPEATTSPPTLLFFLHVFVEKMRRYQG